MKDNLFEIFKNLPEDSAPAVLFTRVMGEVSFYRTQKILRWGMAILSVSFVASSWYLYSRIAELDSLTAFRYSFSTLEFDIHSVFESISFASSSIPPIAFMVFLFNCLAFGLLFYAKRNMSYFYRHELSI